MLNVNKNILRAILNAIAASAIYISLASGAATFSQDDGAQQKNSEEVQSAAEDSTTKPGATTGVIEFGTRDILTGYAVQATVQLEGPESLTLQMDDTGRVKRSLQAGHYRVVVSAPGYRVRKAHLGIGSGSTVPFTVMLESEKLPEEERPEVLDANIIPGATLFHGYVVNGDGKPLSGVRARFVNASVETLTDSKGHFMLSVPTPEPENPGGMGTDTLIYEKPGYKTVILDNFGIATEEMGPAGCALEKGSGVIRRDATHKLMRKEGAPLQEEPQSATPGGARLLPELHKWLGSSGTAFPVENATNVATALAITIPSSIKVGTGGPSDPDVAYQPCSGPYKCTNVFNFPLEGYVSKGLPGEWLASWHTDALKAGSVAYRSYGAYWVANPVCPQVGAHSGQCTAVYDICNTESCQAYEPSDRPSNKKSRAAVSATAGVVLSGDGINIIKAEYAAESNLASDTEYATCADGNVGEPTNNWPCMKDPVCTGKQQAMTHSRGMCQAFADGREYYVLAYVPADRTEDGKFRKIRVELKDKKLTVRAKQGYWAPRPPSLPPSSP